MRKRGIFAVLTGVFLCLGFFSTTVSAYESTVTNCPAAYYVMTGYGWITDAWKSEVRDYNYAEIHLAYGNPMFIATCSYYNPDPGNIGTQPLPPNDAYIVWVEMTVSVRANHGSIIPFTLQYALGESASNVSYDTATWYSGTNGTQTIIGPVSIIPFYYLTYWSNITSLETWTPQMLRDDVPDGYSTWIRILSDNPAGSDSIYVDYVGLEYVWTMDPAWSHGPPGSSNFTMGPMSITGALGTIGFIGMTVCPAYAVMQWRQGGDGRVARFMMSIAAMLVFFTLFLGSLGA